ncbi:unnamed protein product [Chrysoparadoxa australica]
MAQAQPLGTPPQGMKHHFAVAITGLGKGSENALSPRRGTRGWGGIKRVVEKVVGEKEEGLVATITIRGPVAYESELQPWDEWSPADEVCFSRVAQINESADPVAASAAPAPVLSLWQIKQRTLPAPADAPTSPTLPRKRQLIGSATLTWPELRGLGSSQAGALERKLEAGSPATGSAINDFANVRCLLRGIGSDLLKSMQPLSGSLGGMSNSMLGPFNPMRRLFCFQKDIGEEFVVAQEFASEPKFTYSLASEVLAPLAERLRVAMQAWSERLADEKKRQGYFDSPNHAFEHGSALIRVAVVEGRGLSEAGSDSASSSASSTPTTTPGAGAAGAAGASRVSPSMRLADVKRLGGRALAIAKNATQANVKLGRRPDRELKDLNHWVKITYCSGKGTRARERLIGRTNTEYCTSEPTWNSNNGVDGCTHNSPRVRHKAYGSADLMRGDGPQASEATHGLPDEGDVPPMLLVFYAGKEQAVQKQASLRGYLYQERYNLRQGISDCLKGWFDIPLSDLVQQQRRGASRMWVKLQPISPGGFLPGGVTPEVLLSIEVLHAVDSRVVLGDSMRSPASIGHDGEPQVPYRGLYGVLDLEAGGESDDSDADDEASHGMGPIGSPRGSPTKSTFKGSRATPLGVQACYSWLGGLVPQEYLVPCEEMEAISDVVPYPVSWLENHVKVVSEQLRYVERCSTICDSLAASGKNFRSSMDKKHKDLQFAATNLHVQIFSVKDITAQATSAEHFDFATTGAPAAHLLGFRWGGLVSLQKELHLARDNVAAHRAALDSGGTLDRPTQPCLEACLKYEVQVLGIALRRMTVTAQALSIAACSFAAKIEMLARGKVADGELLAKGWVNLGYLIGFEGLLSTQGKENGMVEDTVEAMEIISQFSFELMTLPAGPMADLRVSVSKTRRQTLEVSMSQGVRAALPPSLQGAGGGPVVVPIRALLFTQGIDIQQTVSNQTGRHQRGAVQAEINAASFKKLSTYYRLWHDLQVMQHTPQATSETGPPDLLGLNPLDAAAPPQPPAVALDLSPPLLAPDVALRRLQEAVAGQLYRGKNTAVLVESEEVVRSLGGGRVTFCKSGKDRTAMSVTLEEAALLCSSCDAVSAACTTHNHKQTKSYRMAYPHPLRSTAQIANLLRVYGARIDVAEKNVGRPCYSFNAIQRQFIPPLYRAPLQSIQDVITSFKKRDS